MSNPIASEKILNLGNKQTRSGLVQAIQNLPDGMYRVKVAKFRRTRTLQQNRFLWGVVYPVIADGITEAWGERLELEDVHDLCKQNFLSSPIVNKHDGTWKGNRYKSTARLTIDEFSDYVDKLTKFASESLSVVLPDSSEYLSKEQGVL